ncbi:thymidylate synthase (FAD) [uncultured Thiomicrorhabdus sp.]
MGKEQIKVELIDSMGSDLSTVNSARVSFDKESEYIVRPIDEDGRELFLAERDKKLIKYLASHKHLTPFRHNQITIRCHAPIFLARQLGKHQVGMSWNEVSRRYVDSEPEFFVPDEWRGRPDGSIKQGSAGVIPRERLFMGDFGAEEGYSEKEFYQYVSNLYNWLLMKKVSPEQARMVLPQSMMTSWYWSGNLLSFAHVYKERIAEGAQLEAQWFAEELDKVIRPLFPESWSALVD